MDNATGQASESTRDWRPDLPLTRSAHPTATISESPVGGVSAGRPATTGAQRGAALRFALGDWSDDEVWLKATTRYGGRAPGRRRTSGYISDEGKSLGDINVADGSGWPYTSDVRYLEAGGLLTPATCCQRTFIELRASLLSPWRRRCRSQVSPGDIFRRHGEATG